MGNIKTISELNLGFSDAENYKRRENKELFNEIFFRNDYLDSLLKRNTFFLVGDKGTGKTAYSVFLSNNDYKSTNSLINYIRETDYRKFVTLKTEKNLQFSDYDRIWSVILLLLLSKSITEKDLDHSVFSKPQKLRAITNAIDEYYLNAFTPEIISALKLIEDSKGTAELILKFLKLSGQETKTVSFDERKFIIHLDYIHRQFQDALKSIKLCNNKILFIDGIDIRPTDVPYEDYINCIKGLAHAVWSLNNDFFPSIKDSQGRL